MPRKFITMQSSFAVLSLLLTAPCMTFAQNWEVGGSVGYGVYRNVQIPGAASVGKTGFGSGLAFGAVFGNSNNGWLSGEARYTYRAGNARVSLASVTATAGAESHAIHYDLLVHTGKKEASVRPFLAAGAGVKVFRGTGREFVYQPLSELVVLTHTTQTEPLISLGGGVKCPLSGHTLLRFDFRDYVTPLPDAVLASPRVTKGGRVWMHDFVVMVGVSRVF